MKERTNADGRLGVFALNTANGLRLQYRADERFPGRSTFKTFVAAAILKKPGRSKIAAKAHCLQCGRSAPVRLCGHHGKALSDDITIGQLCATTMQYRDNAAANFLMKELGGPAAIKAYVRSIGDQTFRLDRWEPELNTAIPGDLRDTSTPARREQLVDWLKRNTTGGERMRAGVSADWMVGDKARSCAYGTTNAIGIFWPPTGVPIIAALFFTQDEKEAQSQDDMLALVSRLIVAEFR